MGVSQTTSCKMKEFSSYFSFVTCWQNSWVRNYKKLQNRAARVITKSSYNTNSSYLLNSLSWDNLPVRRTKQKANLMYKCVNLITSPQIIFVTCSLRELCPLIFVTQVKNCTCRNRELTTWSVVSVIAELLFGTIFLRISALQHLYATSREELINGSLYRTPTRQICKPVNRKFYLRWISFCFLLLYWYFYRVLNKDFIYSFTLGR